MSESIEKVLRQLEAQGESINEQRILIQQIISKYPPEVITKLEEAKEPVTPWSMRSLRKAISQYITVQENVQRYVSNNNLNGRGQPFGSRQTRFFHDSQRPLNDSQRPSTEALAVNLQREGNQSRASLPCIFCKGSHFNDMCDKYTTLAERRQKLNQQRRCFICLKVGHVAKDCAGAQKKGHVVTVVEKVLITDVCVHKNLQDKKQKISWLQSVVNHLRILLLLLVMNLLRRIISPKTLLTLVLPQCC